MYFGVTAHPNAAWVAQSLREAFPFDTAPRYIISDNDPLFQGQVPTTLRSFGTTAKKTAPRSPWQSRVAERWVGSLRRELIDHIIVLNARHLHLLASEYIEYYNHDRCHLALDKDVPISRAVESGPQGGEVIALPRVGGRHHRYSRKAA